jgi:hypothetical protein
MNRLNEGIKATMALLRAGRWALVGAAGLLALLLLLARRYEEVRSYALQAVVGSVIFLCLHTAFSLWPAKTERWVRGLLVIRPGWIAIGFFLVAVLGGYLVLGNIPHVSDEVAYQFQARTLATGAVAMPAPPVPEAFNFLHIMIYQGKWYGIMNPGWPAFLAVGELVGQPGLVNPVLGALALLVFLAFFREAGLDKTEGKLAVLFMALSPFLIFMSGTFMSHPVNLLLFGVFCWAWARMLRYGSLVAALVAGLALAINLLVRPVDAAFVIIPFIIQLLVHVWRRPRLLLHVAIVGVVGGGGIGATLAYNRELTGHAREMPVTQYFNQRNPQEQFGIGFGPQMGTKLHGDEWPGFTPVDAVRVTAYRAVEFLKDLYGLPLILLAALLAGCRGIAREWGEWRLVLIASGVAVIGVYFLHFYHGIAYGSRHYYLAVPAVALILGRMVTQALARETGPGRAVASAAVLGLIVTVVTFTIPPLVREYGGGYRGVSPVVSGAVRRAGITRAVIFVEPGSWSWKSAFPLNRYPLERADLLFARDRGAANSEVLAKFPGRPVYYLAVEGSNKVTIRPGEQGP